MTDRGKILIVPEKIFSVVQLKLLNKSVIKSKVLSLLKNFSHPQAMFSLFILPLIKLIVQRNRPQQRLPVFFCHYKVLIFWRQLL